MTHFIVFDLVKRFIGLSREGNVPKAVEPVPWWPVLELLCNVVSHWLVAYTKWSLWTKGNPSYLILSHKSIDASLDLNQYVNQSDSYLPSLLPSIYPSTSHFSHQITPDQCSLTHWGRVTHICIVKLTIIGSDNGLSPGWRQAIIWTNAGILLIGPLGTNFSENLIEILTFSFTKMRLKVSAKWRPFCRGLNELTNYQPVTTLALAVTRII